MIMPVNQFAEHDVNSVFSAQTQDFRRFFAVVRQRGQDNIAQIQTDEIFQRLCSDADGGADQRNGFKNTSVHILFHSVLTTVR